MNDRQAHFGLQEGVLHYFSEVDTGLACKCTCPDPACAKQLIARNLPSPTRKRAPYFAHASQTPGCGGRGNVEALLSRSEEHTSELQSLMRISYAVFCLKKKKTQTK